MKTFLRYFGYISKKAILRTVIFLILGFAFVWISAMTGVEDSRVGTNFVGHYYDHRYTNIGTISTVLGFLCTLVPILELSAFKNRRNLDTLYFFPIKRWKMALAHYLSGFLQIATVHTVCFFHSFGFYLLYTDCFDLRFMIPYYFASLGLGILLYSIFMFINSQANTVVDGVIFSILWMFAFYLLLQLAAGVLQSRLGDDFVYEVLKAPFNWSSVYSPLNNVTVIFQRVIHINQTSSSSIAKTYFSELYMVAVWGVLGVGAIVGYFLTFTKKGAQKAGEVSTTFFGYRTLIPLYCITLLWLSMLSLIFMVFIIAMTIVGYVIFRRGFKFKLPDILSIVGSVILGIVFASIIKM